MNLPSSTTYGTALYVHWPWCEAKCPYCDFNSHTHNYDLAENYWGRVLAELNAHIQLGNCSLPLRSVFFGGGTPSLIPPNYFEQFFDLLSRHGAMDRNTEITVECNPLSATHSLFHSYQSLGINRVSLGVQSLHDDHLRFLGRSHSSRQSLKTIDAALSFIGNVNVDLMYGLPDQTVASWLRDLEFTACLGVGHVSAYQLTVERNTAFYSDVLRGKWRPLDSADKLFRSSGY